MALTNREIASLVWFALLVVFIVRRDQGGGFRKSLRHLLKAFASRYIIVMLLYAALWIILSVQGLASIGLWSADNLKTTIIWSGAFGLVALFNANKIVDEEHYLRRTIREIINVTALVTYIAELYSFPLIVELIVTPIALTSVALMAFTENKDEYAVAHKLSLNVLMLIGSSYVLFGMLNALSDLRTVATPGTLRDFLVPIILSLLLLPFLLILGTLMFYQRALQHITWLIQDSDLKRYAKRATLLRLGLNLDGVRRWGRSANLHRPNSRDEIDTLIGEVKAQQTIEKCPPPVPRPLGWCPYTATTYLANLDLKAGDYHRLVDDEWLASSKPLKINEETALADTLTYRITGDATAAKVLTVTLDANHTLQSDAADSRFVEACEALLATAVPVDGSQKLVTPDGQLDTVVAGRRLRFRYEPDDGRFKSYSRVMTIDHAPSGRGNEHV